MSLLKTRLENDGGGHVVDEEWASGVARKLAETCLLYHVSEGHVGEWDRCQNPWCFRVRWLLDEANA